MITYYSGTVFNTSAEAIVNTVNCVGVMGAGIALEFMLRYPDMFKDYKEKCENNELVLGNVDYYKANEGLIINFPTKWHFKYPSKIEWIETGLKNFCETYKKYEIRSVAFPKLGTSNGGLNWDEVKPLMEKYLGSIDIDVYICLDDLNVAEGIEKEMLETFNSDSISYISSVVKLNSKQKEIIGRKRPYNRFWKISKTDSIGAKTYGSLFKHYYNLVIDKNENEEQITLNQILKI